MSETQDPATADDISAEQAAVTEDIAATTADEAAADSMDGGLGAKGKSQNGNRAGPQNSRAS